MTVSMSVPVMEAAYKASAIATLVTMAMTAAKDTPSSGSRVTTLSVKMAPHATTLPVTMALSVSVLLATLVHSVRERSLTILALVKHVVAMVTVLLRKAAKLPSVTATKAGGGPPAINYLISVLKLASLAVTMASVWQTRLSVSVTLTELEHSASWSLISVNFPTCVSTGDCVQVISRTRRSRVSVLTVMKGSSVRRRTVTPATLIHAKMEPIALD